MINPKTIDNKNKKIQKYRPYQLFTFVGIFFISILTPIFLPLKAEAQSINDLRRQTSVLQAQINANKQKAEALDIEADSLKAAIASLDTQIQQTTLQIDLSTAKIAQLSEELKIAQKELERQKELLRANMLALYKRGDASTVEMLVGSENFSQFIDEQEYLERLKSSIQESTKKVLALKEQIEAQKKQQEELKRQQEAQKQALDNSRAQRAQLLAQTEGEEAKFRGVVAGLQAKRGQVDRELTARLLAGSYVSQGRVEAGQHIARVGMTGFTFGPHLHFEMRNSGLKPYAPPMGSLTWPVPGSRGIVQGFGCVSAGYYHTKCGGGGSLHTGVDIPARVGSSIVAVKGGIIIHRANNGDGYGIKVIVKHDDGTYAYYAHTQ